MATSTSDSHVRADSAPAVLAHDALPGDLIRALVLGLNSESRTSVTTTAASDPCPGTVPELLRVGIAALDTFLQINVTGPVIPDSLVGAIERRFVDSWAKRGQDEGGDAKSTPTSDSLASLRKACIKDLEIDGVSPYAYIPHLELFNLAKYVIVSCLASETSNSVIEIPASQGASTTKYSIAWMRLRIDAWHYKLLTQPSLGPGSNFARSSQWSDVPTLESRIVDGIEGVRKLILGEEVWADSNDTWDDESKVVCLLEAANTYILLGRSEPAKQDLREAARIGGLTYALSGALGKRTKYQENNISQLVVLAKSKSDADTTSAAAAGHDEEDEAKPDALELNDDTLLEQIHFTKDAGSDTASKQEPLPPALAELDPGNQPQLAPLDQIILLAEATLKDACSPTDTLTSEEILPYAVRVLSDKSTNWQIYTQALLVRSRIEIHRSRTVERGVLQLQAVADQVLTDTTVAAEPPKAEASDGKGVPDVPAIQLTSTEERSTTLVDKPTTFFPAPKPTESAPAHTRLQYIHALSSPPRWHLESELAYSWAGVGSLVSALEIFKRLRLWAEVALCLASSAAADDEGGRGSGGEEKAKGIIRWRLFHRTGEEASSIDADDEAIGDATQLKAVDFCGPERTPAPPNAARLWCILGDLEDEPAHYERAWDISQHRYARAQKSLGERYLQNKQWEKARDAYRKATAVNRMSSEMWGRLGDIALRMGDFEEASEAYSRSISSATDAGGGEGARNWSNLGSALWSLYCEVVAEKKESNDTEAASTTTVEDDEEDESRVPADANATVASQDPSKLLAQSFAAFKKGASIAHDNWRIWDNVLTLAARMRPPPVADMVLALGNIIRIRETEDAIDADVLAALLQDIVLSSDKDAGRTGDEGIYEPPRGTPERLVTRLLEEQVVPIITHRSDLWALVSRLRAWRWDYAGAIEAAERAWRAATGGSGGAALLSGATAPGGSSASADWTTDKAAWETVVTRTDELASVLENWGPRVETVGSKWKSKVRSAVRSVMGRGRETWEGSEGWKTLEGIMDGLKA